MAERGGYKSVPIVVTIPFRVGTITKSSSPISRPALADSPAMRKLTLLSAILCLNPAWADGPKEPTAEQAEFFQKKVRPVLEASCFKCHSHQANKSKGNLV